jgi:hypothetical protein
MSEQVSPGSHERREKFSIHIDGKHYEATKSPMTGVELRALARPPIGADRDLFLEVHHGDDLKIEDAREVDIKNGEKFYSAPKNINPGAGDAVT